jgi:hypothetical protein
MNGRIAPDLLELDVSGPGVPHRPLGDVLAGGPTLLVFLRHFG